MIYNRHECFQLIPTCMFESVYHHLDICEAVYRSSLHDDTTQPTAFDRNTKVIENRNTVSNKYLITEPRKFLQWC